MIEAILIKLMPNRVVKTDQYMRRFFLWGSRGDGDDRRSIRLHHIKSSDNDRDFHCHPYTFRSFILWGGYTEHIPAESGSVSCRYGVGRCNVKGLEDFHRLELEKPTWTLVFCGPRQQSWGFWSGKQGDPVVDWRDYDAA